MGRLVLYGASGYMGGLTAHAMVASGARPVLAGRDKSRLDAVAARISQAAGGATLETAVAGAAGPGCGTCSGLATCWCQQRGRS